MYSLPAINRKGSGITDNVEGIDRSAEFANTIQMPRVQKRTAWFKQHFFIALYFKEVTGTFSNKPLSYLHPTDFFFFFASEKQISARPKHCAKLPFFLV